MPPVSEDQRKLACHALNIKLGKSPKGKWADADKMADSMSLKDLTDYCKKPVEK